MKPSQLLGIIIFMATATMGLPDPQSGGKGCKKNGLKLCKGVCVQTLSDSQHCGNCRTKCTSPAMCANGVCAIPCSGTMCSGTCVDTNTDANNCGGCNSPCGGAYTCVAGQCTLRTCSDEVYNYNGKCYQIKCNTGTGGRGSLGTSGTSNVYQCAEDCNATADCVVGVMDRSQNVCYKYSEALNSAEVSVTDTALLTSC